MGRQKQDKYKPGDNTTFYFPVETPPEVMQWINEQPFFNKSVISLIHIYLKGNLAIEDNRQSPFSQDINEILEKFANIISDMSTDALEMRIIKVLQKYCNGATFDVKNVGSSYLMNGQIDESASIPLEEVKLSQSKKKALRSLGSID